MKKKKKGSPLWGEKFRKELKKSWLRRKKVFEEARADLNRVRKGSKRTKGKKET